MPSTQSAAEFERIAQTSEAHTAESGLDPRDPDTFFVELEQYQGPLDALLDLIKTQSLDILDIPIALVTKQYLEAIRRAESLDIELNAEFVLMAATLIHIKSKALLPTPPSVNEEPAEDPRQDLVELLLEREKFLQAAQMLNERRVIEENVWTAGAADALASGDDDSAELQVSLFDLVQTFGEVLQRLECQPVVELTAETVSVASRIRYLKNLLQSDDQPIRLRDVLLRQAGARAVIATFLAVLEMVKAQAVELLQNEFFGEIVMQKHSKFDQAFRSGELIPASDSELEYSQ